MTKGRRCLQEGTRVGPMRLVLNSVNWGIGALALLLAVTTLAGTGCSSSAADRLATGQPPFGGGSGGGGCSTTAQCPSGLICVSGTCVSPADQKPPEQKQDIGGPAPAATPHYVFALDPAGALAVRIDAQSLAIEALPLGGLPVSVEAFAQQDRALVLNQGSATLHLLDATARGSTQVTDIALDRAQSQLAISPDGVWAVASADPNQAPDQGAEGIINLVRLPTANAPAVVFDEAVGYRVSDIVFRKVGVAATDAVAVSKDAVAFIDLRGTPPALPPRVSLPASASADLASRQVVATTDGAFVLIRSFTAAELTVIDVDGHGVHTLALTDIPTDLSIEPGGTAAVITLRATASAAILHIPGDLTDPAGITKIDLGGFNAGQMVVSPAPDPVTGPFGLFFTNASDSFELARLDLASAKLTPYPAAVQKLVQAVGISPDGKSAVIVHRPNANPQTTDAYELAVAKDQGYSMFDLGTAVAQLKRTKGVPVGSFAFALEGGSAAVALRDDVNLVYGFDVLDLGRLVAHSFSLASPPEFLGPLPPGPSLPPRIWITQAFAGGRISFVDLKALTLQTVTGFDLNSQIH
jgi:hypothetical protein